MELTVLEYWERAHLNKFHNILCIFKVKNRYHATAQCYFQPICATEHHIPSEKGEKAWE